MIVNSTIHKEALNASKLASDIDGYRRTYSMKEISEDEEILIHFVAPKLICFEDYRFFLYQNSRTENLKPSFYFRPDYLSYEEYNTTNLWALLMFINDIPTIEQFNKSEILIPSKASITKISKDIVKRDIPNELVASYEIFVPETQKLFYAHPSLPTLTAPITTPVDFVSTDLYYYKEQFTIDIITNKQRYVDLNYDPVIDSIQLKVDEQPTFIYNKHYSVIRNNGRLNRLTWDPRKIFNGKGLIDVISEGTEIEIQYARKVN